MGEERKKSLGERLNNWMKKPHNLVLLCIILFALIIRLYYFVQTLNQPVWWDAAEYLNMAKAWAFGTDYNFIPVRPVLFSLILAGFFKISLSEFLPRFFILLISMASVIGMYYLGREFYNKKVGLISSFLMAIFWLNLFFSFRLLVDVPSLAFFIFSALFFYRYLKTNSHKDLYIGAVIVALGVLFRISTGIFLICFLLYLICTQRLSFVKKKELWISGLIFLLILSPYLIWGYIQFDGFVISQAASWNAPAEFTFENLWYNLSSYLKAFPSYLSWPLLLVFLAGLFSFYKVLVGFDMIFKGKGGGLNKELFLILLFIIPILFTSMSFNHHIENRYIITAFPAVFIIISQVLMRLYTSMNKQKTLAILAIVLLMIYATFFHLNFANNLIKQKIDSYGDIKRAGTWVDENIPGEATIITKSDPQVDYYSNKKAIKMAKTKEDFLNQLEEVGTESVYFMISAYEKHEPWMISYPQENNLTLIYATFFDPQQTQPSLLIYNMSSSSQSSL